MSTAATTEPSVDQHWQHGSFPFATVPGFRQLQDQRESVRYARELMSGDEILLKHNVRCAITRLSTFV